MSASAPVPVFTTPSHANMNGSPQGVYAAPVGFQITDKNTGHLWIKTTPETSNTGWIDLASGGGGGGALAGVGPPGTLSATYGAIYTDTNTLIQYVQITNPSGHNWQ
jgi:hypothetical protein